MKKIADRNIAINDSRIDINDTLDNTFHIKDYLSPKGKRLEEKL